jgi:hypothetical protein
LDKGQIVVSPDPRNPAMKFIWDLNENGTYDQLNTYTKEVIPTNTNLTVDDIIQSLYDIKATILKRDSKASF